MSQADEEVHAPRPGTVVVPASHAQQDEWADLRSVVQVIQRRRPVLIAAIVMVLAQVIWRERFLSHLYFLREDFFNSDLARESGFTWHYLTYVGAGHLMIGERAIIWVLVRVSLYGWHLAMLVTLAFTLAAGLAAFRMLRTLFGERPVILALLGVYLLIPLTIASLGWWTEALESVPLQLAMFLAIDSQVRYLRTGARRSLIATIVWVVVGLIFFEKALVLPLVLLAVGAFVAPGQSWLAGARYVLLRCWREWLALVALLAVYAVVLLTALHTSFVQPHAPASAQSVTTFSWGLVKDSLLLATLGGPWHWYPLPGNWYAIAAAPVEFEWIAIVVAVAVVAVSIWRRHLAWRAWAILAGWLVLADMLPVVISRLDFYPLLRALDTHYVADAVPVLVLCLGLAFLPVVDEQQAASSPLADSAASQRRYRYGEHAWRSAAAALFAVFLVGSIWSAQAYSRLVTGAPAATYISFATAAIEQATPGTPVVNSAVPPDVSFQAADASAARVVGDIDPGELRWISHPNGTIDRLQILGLDGILHPAWVYGASSGPGPRHGCWPVRNGQATVRFFQSSPYLTTLLRIGYIWGAPSSGLIEVKFGKVTRSLIVHHGLHSAYLPVTGAVTNFTVTGFTGRKLCVGDAEAGNPGPQQPGQAPAPGQ